MTTQQRSPASTAAGTVPDRREASAGEPPTGGHRGLELVDVQVEVGRGDARTRVLDGVDAWFPPGVFTAVVGPSGSGKSTLLAVAGALLRPTSGSVLLEGSDLAGLSERDRATVRRTRVGYLFQSGNLVASLSVRDQLLAMAYLAGHRPRTFHNRADELLDAVGMAHRSGHRPHQLSGGERQRVALARALLLRPALLLVDEPTAAVDRGQAGALTELLARTTGEHSCVTVVATHDPVVVDAADRVVDMDRLRVGNATAPA